MKKEKKKRQKTLQNENFGITIELPEKRTKENTMSKLNEIWTNILQELETKISAAAYDTWISSIEPFCIYKDSLILVISSEAHKSVVEIRFLKKIEECMKKCYPTLRNCELITESEVPMYETLVEKNQDKCLLNNVEEEKTLEEPTFVSKYTFDNFVVGKSNEFVAAAAKAVAEQPGKKFNPLFIYGGVGLGKTHIMHAIGNELKRTHPHLRTLYVSCERFTNELIDAIRDTKNPDSKQEFRKKYRNVDVLMIDDIQFIAKTVSTQEEFFHTFDDLYREGKQIILSSDRPPKEINPLEERLRTRFGGGLIADIQPPDLETRIAILQKKAQNEGYLVENQVLIVLANKVTSNVRELEGLLTKVVSYATLINKSPNDMSVVEGALKDYGSDKKEIISVDSIIDCVTDYFNVDRAELVGKKKNKEIVEPRQICIYLITEFLTLPLISIGQIFGNRDHTTVMHARDKIGELVKTDHRIATYVKDLRDSILKQ